MERYIVGALALLLNLVAMLPAAEGESPGPTGEEGASAAHDLPQRVAQLEAMVESLSRELTTLKTAMGVTKAGEPQPPAPEGLAPASAVTISGEEVRLLPSRSVAGGSYGVEGRSVATHGFVDLEYTDAQREGSRNGVSTFDNNHANVFFDALLRPKLRAHLEVEYEHSGSEVEIDQAYVAWQATNWLTFEAGRFYTPFGIERFAWYSPTNQLVSRPAPMRDIIPGNFYASGLQVSGILHNQENEPRFTYELALSDGLGDKALSDRRGSRQTRDNNSSRAISARLSWVGYPWWEVGASYHTQKYDNSSEHELRFLGADFSGRYRGFELRTEWVEALAERGSAALRAPDLEQEGWYAQLAYRFNWDRQLLPSLALVTRYDQVDLDRAREGGDDRQRWSLGINAGIYEHFGVKLEYQLADEKGLEKDDDAFLSQLVVDF